MYMDKFTQGVITYCKGFWSCLLNIGITEDVAVEERRYVRFANVVAALTALAIVSYIPSSLLEKNYVLAWLQAVDLVCVLSVLWLNYSGYHRIARQTYLVVVNVFVLINACVIGFESRVHDFFYFTYVLPFLLFRVKDFKNIIAGVFMAILSYNIFQHIYPNFTAYNLSLADQMAIYNINIWMKFILFGIAIYILAYYNHTSETELALTNEKLEDRAVELKRSNQDLEQFAYIISHDLKAPVRNISSFMAMLSTRYTKVLPPDALELTTMSKTCADRLARQIDDMLSYCRVDRNLPPTSIVDLNEMVKTIKLELYMKLKETNTEIIVERQLPTLKDVHSTMLFHVFQNLVANGLKFNENPNREVKIDFIEEGDSIKFSIADNGIGIAQGFESKLFQMFKRLHTQDKFEGTGIGLAICKKIITFYDGEIWYESEPGNGTTFYFTLPKSLVGVPVVKTPEMLAEPTLIYNAA